MVNANVQIFEYTYTPLVIIKVQPAKITDGNFKIIHPINITAYEKIYYLAIPMVRWHVNDTSPLKPQCEYLLNSINEQLQQLQPNRGKRSINWIGSAWKWIAGTPDAYDFDKLLTKQNELIENSNRQILINRNIINSSNKMIDNFNQILEQLKDKTNENLAQTLFNKLLILKEEIDEITNAIHWAKKGIINTKILGKGELDQIMHEMDTLPYGNTAEALNYAAPSVAIKERLILYIVSIPLTSKKEYNHLILKSVTNQMKRIVLDHNHVLASKEEYYTINKECESFRDISICNQDNIVKLPKESCIPKLINGINANCTYAYNTNPIIEQINENLIFVDNYEGKLINECENQTKYLNGTYLIKLKNCSIDFGNQKFISKQIKSYQPLPSIFQTNLSQSNIKMNMDQLHLQNIKQIKDIKSINSHSLINYIVLYLIIGVTITIIIIWIVKTKNNKIVNSIPQIPQKSLPLSTLNIPLPNPSDNPTDPDKIFVTLQN